MAFLVIVILISILLHLLTPHWFLNDYLNIADWIMIVSGLIGLLIIRVFRKNKFVFVFSFILSINSLLYYITTVQILSSEIEDERAVYRLLVSLNIKDYINIGLSKLIEIINALQI